MSKRLSLSTQILSVVTSNLSATPNADPLTVGNDTISGDAGNDIVLGDVGVIAQTPGTNRILTTGNVISVTTVRPTDGGADASARRTRCGCAGC